MHYTTNVKIVQYVGITWKRRERFRQRGKKERSLNASLTPHGSRNRLARCTKVPLYQEKVQSIKRLFLGTECFSLSISCIPSCRTGVGWLGWGLSKSLQHISAQEQSLLCLILLAPLHADPPTVSLSYDYFIILNSLCRIAVAPAPLEQSDALAIQYIHTTVIWTALRCGSVPVPRLDSARPLVPSVPSCAVCEGPVDAKTIGISLEQPEGRCPELLAANDVHLFWQNQRGWGWVEASRRPGQETAAPTVLLLPEILFISAARNARCRGCCRTCMLDI